jgi:hypothetical protein
MLLSFLDLTSILPQAKQTNQVYGTINMTKKKIFDLDPGKLYFINKRVKLREKKYFLSLRRNNECSK